MSNKKATKRALLTSILAICLCLVMLIGSTFAWFTDTASTAVNQIQSGTLKVDIVNEAGESIKGKSMSFVNKDNSSNILWEPGVTFKTPVFQVKNIGNLALKYKLTINGVTGNSKLLEVIKFSVVKEDGTALDLAAFEGYLETANARGEKIYIQGHMEETAGNDYQNKTLEGLGITVAATQYTHENDSKDNQYDANASYPTTVTTEPGKNKGTVYPNATKTTYTYSISTAEELKAFAQMVTDTAAPFPNEIAYHAILNKDIDMTDVEWGSVSIIAKNYVYVTLDGNGHAIKNLTVTDAKNAALFTSVGCESAGSAKIMNLTVDDSSFEATGDGLGDGEFAAAGVFQARAGGYCNYSNCHVVNCTVKSAKYGGGFIGYDACGNIYTVENCTVKNTGVSSTAAEGTSTSMGGFLGYTQTTGIMFTGCTVSDNTVTGKYAGNYVGTINADCTFAGCKVGDSPLTVDTCCGRNTGKVVTVNQ